MRSETGKAIVFALVTLLFSGCSAPHRIPHGEAMKGAGIDDGRPCIFNLSVKGGYWAGHTGS